MDKLVTVDQYDAIRVIRLNRGEHLNALNLDILKEMLAQIAIVAADPQIQALIISGSGKAFCAGGDLTFIRNHAGTRASALGLLTHHLHRLILDLRQLPKPVIAAINGTAAGAGISLGMACDLRLAASTAKFKQAYTSVGLVPDGGWNVLVGRQIGMARAAELLLLDEAFDAQRALELGLLNRVVEPGELMSVALETARRAVCRADAFRRSKASLRLACEHDLETVLEAERQAIMAAAEDRAFDLALQQFFSEKAQAALKAGRMQEAAQHTPNAS